MERTRALETLAALAQPTRLDVVRMLLRAGPGGLSAGHLSAQLDIRANTLSANLTVLLNARLVRNRRRGRSIHYFAEPDTMRGLLGFLMEECCGGAPETCRPVLAALACGARPGDIPQ